MATKGKDPVSAMTAVLKKMPKQGLAVTVYTAKALSDRDLKSGLKSVSEKFGEKIELPASLLSFYKNTSLFGFSWSEPKPAATAVSGYMYLGNPISFVRASETDFDGKARNFYGVPRLMDKAGPSVRVTAVFKKALEEPELYYQRKPQTKKHRIALSFEEYITTGFSVRGLVGWQEFFIADPKFKLTEDGIEFLPRLNRLFPDVDDSYFRQRLAERSQSTK